MLQMMMLRRLDLTDAQRDQVKSDRRSHKDEIKAVGDRAMRRTWRSKRRSPPTRSTRRRSGRRAPSATVEADTAVARARGFSEVWQILTTEQQAKLKEMQAKMEQRMEGRPGGAAAAGPR